MGISRLDWIMEEINRKHELVILMMTEIIEAQSASKDQSNKYTKIVESSEAQMDYSDSKLQGKWSSCSKPEEKLVKHVSIYELNGDDDSVVVVTKHVEIETIVETSFEKLESDLGVEKDEENVVENLERFWSHTHTCPYGPQSISFDVSFYDADFVYGIPKHATSLALRPTRGLGVDDSEPYQLFNLDVFEYIADSPFGLYGSIPFMISHGKSHGSSGFFWLNAVEMQIDVLGTGWNDEYTSVLKLPSDKKRVDTLWMKEAGVVDAFFFVGLESKNIVIQYTSVTGTLAMPQLFAIAYHQCRWNYSSEEDVCNGDAKFNGHDIPYDVLWLDIEHTDGKNYFMWDRLLFPNPEEMQKKLAEKGRHMVTIVDDIHKETSQKVYYVKDATGKGFNGWC
ncbi:probable glucan 1,3-alpha-glucosidase [Olea europaea subsp. europaea]|uniref:Glucosidase II subunit alpha n=1 Tax=Olea europaea subsp. europaea TaxID=158383 RepID=A0A8S0SB07_OLEEU|nr:probable glucan 1,3-alpha-glucosidase [Olea europaea subsp. europaea]